MKLFLLSVFLALPLLALDSHAGWGSGSCAPGGRGVTVKAKSKKHSWKYTQDRKGVILYLHGRKLGKVDLDTAEYRPWLVKSKKYGKPRKCPATWEAKPVKKKDLKKPAAKPAIKPAIKKVAAGPEWKTHGVHKDKIHDDGRYSLSGKQVPKSKAIKELKVRGGLRGDGKLDDDSAKPYLTVAGKDDATTAKGVEALKKSGIDLGKFRVWSLPANHWSLAPFQLDKDKRFLEHGLVILCQGPPGPDGKSEPVAVYGENVEAVRKIDPKYDANKVPEAGKNDLQNLFGKVPVPVWILSGAAILVLFSTRKKD